MSDRRIHYHVFSHPNQTGPRPVNEDAILAGGQVWQGHIAEGGEFTTSRPNLFAISNGLHVTHSAAVASRTLLRALEIIWQADTDATPGRKIRQLHARYCEAAIGHPQHEGMACTLVAAEIRGSRARVYHVGDSRAWHIFGRRTKRLTRDHTVLESMVRGGEISSAKTHDHASIYGELDNYFMASPFETLPAHDLCELTLGAGDTLLLASDGISVLDDREISACATRQPGAMAKALFDAAIVAGSDDNISIVTIRVESA